MPRITVKTTILNNLAETYHNLPSNASIGASGEHLVLSNLLKLNFVAGLAPYNTKEYDLIASNLNGDKQINIQVKTALVQYAKNDESNLKWILSEKNEVVNSNLIYSFVYLVQESNYYRIFNIPSIIVSEFISIGHVIYLKIPGPNGKKHKNTSMRTLSADAYKNITSKYNRSNLSKFINKKELNFLNNHKNGWLNKYENNWDIFNY